MSYRDRLEYFREQIAKGPAGLTVGAWVELAGVSQCIVEPRYPSEISPAKRIALAQAAAKIVSWDQGQMEAWMVHGEAVPDLASFLARLPNLARCVGCNQWLERAKVIRGISRCHGCKRMLDRQQRSPLGDAMFTIAAAKLPEIRVAHPALATVVEHCIAESYSITVARVQRGIGLSRAKTEALLAEFGLTKVTVAAATEPNCHFPGRASGADRGRRAAGA